MAATRAGMPFFSRRKSMARYCFLCPPPRCQMVISPCALRPPERFLGSTRAFSGVSLVTSLLSSMVIKRREAVYGLNVFSAITLTRFLLPGGFEIEPAPEARSAGPRLRPPVTQTRHSNQERPPPKPRATLQIVRVLDHLLAGRQLHVGLLPVPAMPFGAAAAAKLAVINRRAHARYLDFENFLHRFLDLRLGRGGGDFKDHRVLGLLHAETLLGDDWPPNHLKCADAHGLALRFLRALDSPRPADFVFRFALTSCPLSSVPVSLPPLSWPGPSFPSPPISQPSPLQPASPPRWSPRP